MWGITRMRRGRRWWLWQAAEPWGWRTPAEERHGVRALLSMCFTAASYRTRVPSWWRSAARSCHPRQTGPPCRQSLKNQKRRQLSRMHDFIFHFLSYFNLSTSFLWCFGVLFLMFLLFLIIFMFCCCNVLHKSTCPVIIQTMLAWTFKLNQSPAYQDGYITNRSW